MIIDGMLVTEAQARTAVPYRAHTGKFIVDIGNGTDPNKHDYCAIIQESGKFVVLIMHGCSIAAYDGKKFVANDFSHPLNHKKFLTAEEAYDKLMRWIGKMVKKDDRGRYYTDTRYHDYQIADNEFIMEEMIKVAKAIKSKL